MYMFRPDEHNISSPKT